MEIIIESHGLSAGEQLTDLIQEKLNKLDHLSHNIIRADVTLVLDGDAVPNKVCEIRLEVPGNDLFVKKTSESFEMATAEAVDALQMQLRKHKERELSKR